MAITGTSTGTVDKAFVVDAVKTYLANEAKHISDTRAMRYLDHKRQRRAFMVEAMYQLFFDTTAASGTGTEYDALGDSNQAAVLSWFVSAIGLQIVNQAIAGTS